MICKTGPFLFSPRQLTENEIISINACVLKDWKPGLSTKIFLSPSRRWLVNHLRRLQEETTFCLSITVLFQKQGETSNYHRPPAYRLRKMSDERQTMESFAGLPFKNDFCTSVSTVCPSNNLTTLYRLLGGGEGSIIVHSHLGVSPFKQRNFHTKKL